MKTLTHNRRRGPTLRSGLTMVEAMVSLVIAATVLTAVGAAFTSTARAMQINDQFFKSTQSARISMTRILAQVRNGLVDDTSTATNLHLITNTVTDDAGNVIKAAQDVTYKLVNETDPNLGPKRLLLVINAGLASQKTYELARNVTTTAPFAIEMGTDANHAACVARVAVSVAVQIGVNEVRLSGAAAPRRSLSY